MAGLKQTTAKLARYGRNWEQLLAKTATGPGAGLSSPTSERLVDVEDFGSNPGNLRMHTYLPDNCPPGAPLVVVLHGCTQTADGYECGVGWSTLADRHGFALLLPEQQRANNPNVCFNWFLPGDTRRDAGEALSIRQMIDSMIAGHDLDRSRVFITGLSAGGAMTAVMLATYPEVFAGGAIIAGLPFGAAGNVQEALDCMFQGKSLAAKTWGDRVRSASPHKGPWPKISIWHGGADTTVQPLNAEELAKQWTDVHGLPSSPSEETVVDGYPRRAWKNPSGETLVESYSIPGMAHGTPIAAGTGDENCGTPRPFVLEAGISSSYRIAEFWGLLHGAVENHLTVPDRTTAGQSGRSAGRAPAESSTAPAGHALAKPIPKQPMPMAAGKASKFDPQTVINKALRSAGLLKG